MLPAQEKNRSIDGVLLLNKPHGITSNAALQEVKRLFAAEKAGHTGSLDPIATGVLPICFGESTKFSQFLLDADKTYRSRFCLGVTTSTGDVSGDRLVERDAGDITREQVEAALLQFVGEIEQIPPMHSALRHNGRRLYRLARKGREIERNPRKVVVRRIELLAFKPGIKAEIDIEITCSKGTYVRSIAEDIGSVLGCGGHVMKLHRSASGPFNEAQAFTLQELAEAKRRQDVGALDRFLMSVDAPLGELPAIKLSEQDESLFDLGIAVAVPEVYHLAEEGGMVRVFSASGQFMGVAMANDIGQIAPKRLVNRHVERTESKR